MAGEPCAYWRFDSEIFQPPVANPNNVPRPEIISKVSDTKDRCHSNLHNVSDERLKKALKRETENNLRICVGGTSEPFTADRAIELFNRHYPDPT